MNSVVHPGIAGHRVAQRGVLQRVRHTAEARGPSAFVAPRNIILGRMKVDTIASNEQYARLEICGGCLPIDQAATELLRIVHAQNDALRAELRETKAALASAAMKETGGAAID